MNDKKINHEKKAIQYFQQGLGCAQALLCAYEDEIFVSHNMAVRLSQEYAAGTYQICGPVLSMHVILNRLLNGTDPKKPYVLMDKALRPGTLMDLEFKKEFGSLTCREMRESMPNQEEPICLRVIETVSKLLDKFLENMSDEGDEVE